MHLNYDKNKEDKKKARDKLFHRFKLLLTEKLKKDKGTISLGK
jgi:hypothetical protein